MSRFNLSNCENKSMDSNTDKTQIISNINDLRKNSNIPDFINRGWNIIGNNMTGSNVVYDLENVGADIKKGSLNLENKKQLLKKPVYEEKTGKLISPIIEDNENIGLYDSQNCRQKDRLIDTVDNDNESIPLVNIFNKYNTNHCNKNLINPPIDPYRESFPVNKMAERLYVHDIQDGSNLSSVSNRQNFNGFHVDRIKNVTSYGSSFLDNTNPQAMFSVQNSQSGEYNNYRNHPKQIRSHNVYYSQQVIDTIDPKNQNVDFQNSSDSSKKVNLNKHNNIILSENNKIQFPKNTKLLIPQSANRKEAVLIQQPECYESHLSSNLKEMCLETLPNNSASESKETGNSIGMQREHLIPVDYIYPNSYYGQTFPVHENRKNISYISQQMPIQLISVQGPVVLNNSINSNLRNIHTYPHYCLTPIVDYPNDKIKSRDPMQHESKLQDSTISNNLESFSQKSNLLDESHLFYSSDPVKSQQDVHQYSHNSELNSLTNFPYSATSEPNLSNISLTEQINFQNNCQQNHLLIETSKTTEKQNAKDLLKSSNSKPEDNNTDAPRKIGKFLVTNVIKTNEPVTTVLKSKENNELQLSRNLTVKDYINEDILKPARPQQNSRFKKTRIRETVERWCMNGLNAYDCRFKIIPSKIMDLYNSKPEYLSKEIDMDLSCTKCETHDKEKYCHDVDYHKKEFKFWHNGNHIDLCSELEEDIENYCRFHAKILKLLNQNQNLSLSKYSNNSFDFSENTNLTTPQLFQTVLISSPDHDNYIINIDAQAPHMLLSAPPVSPSVMNTAASMSNLPTNIQSPRSATTMVMLKCATPVLLSNATRNATLLNESISIEKLNHMPSSNIGIETDAGGNICSQQIIANENNSIIDLWQSGPIKTDQLPFKLTSPTYVAGTVIADKANIDNDICNHQHSLYSIGHVSPLYYPIYQQPLPTIPSSIITNKYHDHNSFLSNIDENGSSSNSLFPDIIEEINKTTNSFKSVITNIFQSEYDKLINEIKLLRKSNEQLATELLKMKAKSDNLEKLLKEKQGLSSNELLSSASDELLERSTDLNHSGISIPEFQHSKTECNKLI